MLMEDVGSGEEQEEEDETSFQGEDSGSKGDFLVEDNDGNDCDSSKKKKKKKRWLRSPNLCRSFLT